MFLLVSLDPTNCWQIIFMSSLSSLSLWTLQTTTLFSLSQTIVAWSQLFNLHRPLKLLLVSSHEDTGTTDKILVRTYTWSNNPRISTGIPLRTSAATPLLLQGYLLRKRGNCTERDALFSSGYWSRESSNSPVRSALSTFCRRFRSKWSPNWTSTQSNTLKPCSDLLVYQQSILIVWSQWIQWLQWSQPML